MYELLARDRAALSTLLDAAATYSAGVVGGIDSRTVAIPPRAFDHHAISQKGDGCQAVLERFRTEIAPFLSASAGPRYLGFVTGGATPAAVVGDWLATVFDQNVATRLDGSLAVQVERSTVAMLRQLFRLPECFDGSFVSGATMSNFVGLVLAREWAGRIYGIRVSEQGVAGLPPLSLLAATPHSSVTKALSMMGAGRETWHKIPSVPGREAMDVPELARRLAGDHQPHVVVASAGTLNTRDFDDFAALASLKQRYRFWLHVDAAFGGFASLSPSLDSLLSGWECADSICVDLHKWLNVPYDSAVTFTRHPHLQVDVFRNAAPYFGHALEDPDPVHLTPENSRRWRALPAWFTLAAYGSDGYREIVERSCLLARSLGDKIDASNLFELLAPVRLNVVCFALREPHLQNQFIAAVRDSGSTFLTPTVLCGKGAVRAAFSNWRTTSADLDTIWESLKMAAEQIVQA
jgi:glutamate/tyrosine decarboxylase-like PLP-dependent enzyme